MARLSLPSRRRGGDDALPAPEPPPSRAPRRSAPSAGTLRRERRLLLRAREHALRDLGGLLYEMYRRDLFREDLLRGHCADLVDLDVRLQEIEILLAGGDLSTLGARCACGAPLAQGAHFCANCGRPAGEEVVVACTTCGHPLPADARFCAGCGTPAEPTEEPGRRGNGDAVAGDPWER